MTVFSLALHPASDGDALILTWGATGALHHALVDLGRRGDYKKLKPLLATTKHFDLVTFTHIDADHIEGAVPLFADADIPIETGHVWFNGRVQLETADDRLPVPSRPTMGAVQAEKITEGILRAGWRWNAHFASGVVSVDSPEGARPIDFPGGLTLTLLSPDDRKLAELMPTWDEELTEAGLHTTDEDAVEAALAAGRVAMGPIDVETLAMRRTPEDSSPANGAGIAFLAEFAGKRVLMAADAHPDMLIASLKRLGATEATPLRIDCFKLPHHASKANVTNDLLKLIDCTTFAVSTNGKRHGHPDEEAIARVLFADRTRRKTLVFNFRQENTVMWSDPDLMAEWNYACVFPEPGHEGIVIDL